jgi:hypothetical protein
MVYQDENAKKAVNSILDDEELRDPAPLMKIGQSCCWSAAENNSVPASQDAGAKSTYGDE